MKATTLLSILLCLYFTTINAQVSNDAFVHLENMVLQMKRSGDSIQQKVAVIDAGRMEIESKLLTMYQNELKEMELTIKDAFDKTDVISISATYQEVIKSIISLHNEITMINNFTDAEKVFGIDFATRIQDIAMETLLVEMDHAQNEKSIENLEKRKLVFRSILKSIIYNPIISGLLKSNPITSVAHSIINQTINLYQNKLENVIVCRNNYTLPDNYKDFKNDYPAFKNSYENSSLSGLTESQRQELDQSISEFTKKLKPLIRIFDDLSAINEKYASSLKVFMKASEQTIERVKPLEYGFFETLGVDTRQQAREKINQFFNIGTKPDLNTLETKLNHQQMKNVLLYSEKINEGLILLRNDFLKIITLEIELAMEYIQYFSNLKEGKESVTILVNSESLAMKVEQFDQLRLSLEAQKQKLDSLGQSQ